MAPRNKAYNLKVKETGTAELKKIVKGLDGVNKSLKGVAKTSKKTSNILAPGKFHSSK